ncbi:dienelactone hydrolase family protein [Novosphingobium rosa]|uniref:dienelactone hydrolase family protein n=1 Tax=Novosphingobium rosa TaxID=76978 RepID=UPI00082D2D4D|nr:dienelactone hydrolase family protein [Novosphingobium rosa]
MTDTILTIIDVTTPDSVMPTYVHTPHGEGPWPTVIMLMDAPGIRPAMQDLAARLASHSFAVFLPDLFYRAGPYEPIDAKKVFGNPDLREEHRAKFMAAITTEDTLSDLGALLEAITLHDAAQGGPVGVVGYCMGGRLALTAAGTFGDRIAIAAAYHPGGLATEKPDSPHLLAPRINARVYVAGAAEDKNFDDAQKTRLIAALDEAGVENEVETYPAHHGWVPADMPAHDHDEAEHHWRTLVPLMDALRP